MFNISDDLVELVYVVDPETYELLYINRAGKEIFHLEDWEGKLCYKALQGKEQPCEFCTNHLLNEDTLYRWNYLNPVVQRHYQLADKLIDWNGKKAKLEIAFDVTELENQKIELQRALETENVVTLCAKKLLDLEDINESLTEVLEILSTFLQADRGYIFEIKGDLMNNTCEWNAPGIPPQIDFCQNMPLSLVDRWQPAFREEGFISIEEVEKLRLESPAEYEALHQQGIRSLIVGPLLTEGKLVGYVGVDNYKVPLQQNAISLVKAVSYFISAILRHRRALEFDSLTGLYNRYSYMRDVKKPLSFPMGAVYIDINSLKQMNDRSGHSRGDHALVQTAKIISGVFGHARCYRVGGDEFVILAEETREADFESRVRRVNYELHQGHEISASVGSAWSKVPIDAEKLVLRADEQMYDNKKSFYRGKALTKRYRSRLDDILGMSRPGKLQERIAAGCFSVFFQPKFSIQTRELTGAEALARYRDENGRRYSPIQFIPYLEEAGTISILDYYVFEQVCLRLREWRKQGLEPAPVAVNFSRHTLQQDSFVDQIEAIRERYQIPTELLEIEVTETIEATDRERFYQAIRQLQEHSFRIAIDDFGVSNANLSLLTEIDFDVLKIDKSVTGNILKSRKTLLILETLIQICEKVGIRIVAEGVETIPQLALLKSFHCHDAQGYLFSQPIPEEQYLEDYLKPLAQKRLEGV